jgi:hypothetical protein
MYVHEGPLNLPTTAHLPYFISFHGKKNHGYFLNRPRMIAELNAVPLVILSVAVASVMELTLRKGISKSSWSELTKCMLAYLL